MFVAQARLDGAPPATAANYQAEIADTIGVSAATAAVIAARYPLSAYPSPPVALGAVGTDAIFACPALSVDQSLSKYVPVYAYEFNDENAPERYLQPVGFPYGAAHESEVQYLFSLRNAPFPGVLTPVRRAPVRLLGPGRLAGLAGGAVAQTTCPPRVEIVAQALFARGRAARVIAIELPRSHAFMHPDTVMTMIDTDTFVVYPYPDRQPQHWDRARFRAEEPGAQVAEGAGAEPGDVHLGDAEPPADLRLGQAVTEVHDQDLLLARGKLGPVGGDGQHAEHVVEPRILLAEGVGQGERGTVVGLRRVQRRRREGELRLPGLTQLVPADSEVLGQVGVGRGAAQLLGQRPGRIADLEDQLLHRPLDVERPALVAEVPLELAGDAGSRVGGEAGAGRRIEVVDRLQQAEVPHLHQVLGRHRAAPVTSNAGPDQALVTGDEQLARGRMPLADQG